RYIMYGEDIDLSYTLVLNGFTNIYYGGISVLHYKGESTRKDGKYLKVFFGAMSLFIQKYYDKNLIEYFLFRLGLNLRYAYARLIGRFKNEDSKPIQKVNLNQLQKIQS